MVVALCFQEDDPAGDYVHVQDGVVLGEYIMLHLIKNCHFIVNLTNVCMMKYF